LKGKRKAPATCRHSGRFTGNPLRLIHFI
jgi:hypothetical protein